MFRKALILLLLSLLSACATQTLERMTYKSYAVGQTKTAATGEAFLVDQDGTKEIVKTWVGLINSPSGWKVEDRYSQDYLRRELIYGGRHGNVVEISYREYRGGLAAPAFFQNLKYDLAQSADVRFQNFEIEILDATNHAITYRVLSD